MARERDSESKQMRGGSIQNRLTAPLIASPLFLSESIAGLADGAGFLNALCPADRARVSAEGRRQHIAKHQSVFTQGDSHTGIFIIETGRVRVFYTGPTGRELTLAYWTPGNFIGGPSIHGGGAHQWSGVAIEPVEVTVLSADSLSRLMREVPAFSVCLVEGLVAKAQCYTAVLQMLGTRSVIERLAQLLLNLADLYGTPAGGAIAIGDMVTHDEIAAMVGATRQWVAMMLRRFRDDGVISLAGRTVLVLRRDHLEAIVQGS